MKIPQEVQSVIEKLTKAGYEAYIVGGCVRDLLMDKAPKDWDVTTNAKPEEIQKIFSSPEGETPTESVGAGYHSFYENTFGTVGVVTGSEDPTLAVIEVTTYRAESGYTDKRRPDEVKFVATLDEDLKRRDFTINSIALGVDATRYTLHDPFDGQNHIELRFLK